MSQQVDHGMSASHAPMIVEFSDEQQVEFRDALFAAQMSLLDAIRREAVREGSYDGPRNVSRLTASLSSLRAINSGIAWLSHAPFEPFHHYVDEEFDDSSE